MTRAKKAGKTRKLQPFQLSQTPPVNTLLTPQRELINLPQDYNCPRVRSSIENRSTPTCRLFFPPPTFSHLINETSPEMPRLLDERFPESTSLYDINYSTRRCSCVCKFDGLLPNLNDIVVIHVYVDR